MGLPDDDIDPPLEAIEFLARSENRVMVLDALNASAMERYDLEDDTGISRPTLSRILDDFEDRGWVTPSGQSYETTQLGVYVAEEFTELLERMQVDEMLGDVMEWFPDREYGFDLACLASAEIVRPRKTDALAPTTRIVRWLEEASRVRVLTYTLLPDAFQACWRKTVHGDQDLEVVFDPETVATLATDQRSVEQACEMLETGQVAFYQSEDTVPYVVIIPDDEVVVLCLSGEDGEPRAVIDTDHETVQAWAESTFASYRDEALHLDRSQFTE